MLLYALLMFLSGPALAATELKDVQYTSLAGNKVQVRLIFSGPVSQPQSFATNEPARIAIDFAGVVTTLEQKTFPIGLGDVHSVNVAGDSSRTRVVVNLNESAPYNIATQGSQVTIDIDTQGSDSGQSASTSTSSGASSSQTVADSSSMRWADSSSTSRSSQRSAASGSAVRSIDFRRGENGEGRILIRLPSPDTRVTVREQGRRVFVDVLDSSLPQRLFRRLDVVDFGTPVVAVESRPKGSNVEVAVETNSEYDYMAYQTDSLFTLDLRSMSAAEKTAQRKDKAVYDGKRLSLNFQDIEVRAVLQVLADFTDLNLVASDTVRGNITLRLKNVPWDQALDIILKTKGLAMRRTGNVIMVAPAQELAAQEKLEMESAQQIEELAPLHSEFIQVNYAKASDLASLLKSKDNQLLTKDRGSVTVDARTNTLLVQDTADKLEEIRGIIQRLDIPVRQVMIESRIVIAEDSFARDLGVRWGLSTSGGSDSGTGYAVNGGLDGTQDLTYFDSGTFGGSSNQNTDDDGYTSNMIDLGITDPTTDVNFLLGKVGSYLLQLELQAMQTEGRGEVISSPRVITSDQHQATIKVGEQIPYQTVSDDGTDTEFKDAVLQLEVTPHITPDDRIIMDLMVNKDAADYTNETDDGVPIDTRSVETSVLVDNGETIVLGGVYERTKSTSKEQVPWLGDLPVVGRLFQMTSNSDETSELLVFVTPKILKEDLAQR